MIRSFTAEEKQASEAISRGKHPLKFKEPSLRGEQYHDNVSRVHNHVFIYSLNTGPNDLYSSSRFAHSPHKRRQAVGRNRRVKHSLMLEELSSRGEQYRDMRSAIIITHFSLQFEPISVKESSYDPLRSRQISNHFFLFLEVK